MTSTTTLFLVLYHSSQGHTCTITTFMLLMKRGCHNSPTLQEISTANGFSMNIELKMHGSCGRLSTSTMIWTNLQQPISSHNKTHHNARTSRPFQKKHGNICARGPTSGSIILAKRRGVLKVAIYLHKYIYNAINNNFKHYNYFYAMHYFIFFHTTLLIGYASLDGLEKISSPMCALPKERVIAGRSRETRCLNITQCCMPK